MADRAVPEVSDLTAPYWEAAQQRRLALQRCGRCYRFVHFPEYRCPSCASTDLAFESVSGDGVIETYSVIHRSVAPGFAERTPYVIAWINLAEQVGLRTFGNIVDCPSDEVRIEMPVRVCFEEIPGFGLVPTFAPA